MFKAINGTLEIVTRDGNSIIIKLAGVAKGAETFAQIPDYVRALCADALSLPIKNETDLLAVQQLRSAIKAAPAIDKTEAVKAVSGHEQPRATDEPKTGRGRRGHD